MAKNIPFTIQNVLQQSFTAYADRPSLGFAGCDALSYHQLQIKVEEIAGLLFQLGIQKDDKVAILSRNMPNWAIAYFAITAYGSVSVPILPEFSNIEITNILEHSESKAIFISKAMMDKLDPEIREKILVIILENFEPLTCPFGPIGNLQRGIDEILIDPEQLAAIIYTSGTTGRSKGVMLTHRNIVSNAIGVLTIQPVAKNDVMLSVLPLSHTYENTLGLIVPIMQGASVYYLEGTPSPTQLIDALQKVRPTTMLTVPLIIEKIYKNRISPKLNASFILRFAQTVPFFRRMIYRKAGREMMKMFGGRLIFFGIGGAKLDEKVERFLKDARFPYAIGYGMTESSPLIAGTGPKHVRIGSTGPAMEGVEIIISNPDARTGEGEIWARSASVMKGYFKDPELTSQVLTPDGWLKTGDLGCFDEDHHLYIKGRIKTMILSSNGENIYPEEIEAIINRLWFVLESLVVEKKGRLVAMVHLNYEALEKHYKEFKGHTHKHIGEVAKSCLTDLKAYINSRVNKFSQIHFVIEHSKPFEKTPTLKIKRYLYQRETAQ